ncbi:unnamed protein product [Darwinula stevensoni]|uniref:Uncharacterized protein n=1 Tax=Darwinula stevensoni TaxID=69355 RepID=A0A7R9AI30_9CRUS|nr:unnamed protein product [Darwinula stevensoni]CAG0905495.1 unnamed protein product [Darwinula stevensoni]
MELNSKRQSQQVQLTAIDNNILRQKFLAAIEAIEEQEREREREYKDLLKLLEDS